MHIYHLFLAESIELFCHAVDFGIEFFCVDGRHLFVTHDGLAIDDDGVDVHGVSGIHGKGDAVEARVPVEAASVHEDDIGECALFQLLAPSTVAISMASVAVMAKGS